MTTDKQQAAVRIGAGTKVHLAWRYVHDGKPGRWWAHCNPVNTKNINQPLTYRVVPDGTPITCSKCMAAAATE